MRGTRAALVGAMALAALGLATTARAQDRYYIANDDHTDWAWTASPADYHGAYQTMLDFYMDQADTTAGLPSDFRGRFNCDGTMWLYTYERDRMPADFARLVDHVRAGNITVPLNSLVILPGAMPTEAVLRDMYYAGRLERRYDLDLDLVVPMENQTLPGGVASLWSGAGARYSWKGICDCATSTPAADRPREVYWFVGPDGHGVLMKWASLRGGNQSLGGYAEARDPVAIVDFMATDAAYRADWPWAVRGAFGYGWDDLMTTTGAFVATAMAMSGSGRRVIVSNEVDFFRDMEATYGTELPSFAGSFGNEWEMQTASLAAVTADVRAHVEKLRTAEALATVVSLVDASFMSGREAARDDAFMNMGAYFEHSFTVGPAVRAVRVAFERDAAASVAGYVDALHDDALARLGTLVPAGTGERFAVFNALSFARTGPVDLPAGPTGAVHVIEVSSGAQVPSQVVADGGGGMRLRILARDVPPVGYAVYEVVPGAGTAFSPAATVTGTTLDNGTLAVRLANDGSIPSVVVHGATDRELVESGRSLNRLNAATAGTVATGSCGAVSCTLRATAGGSPAHTTDVTLYAGMDRVDVEDTITENFGNSTAGFEWAFALTGASVRHEEVGMIARVARAADGGDYAAENSRTDYLTLNHFVDFSERDFGVTLSSQDSHFMQIGASGLRTLDTSHARVLTVTGMFLDGLGIPMQGGDTRFVNRYAIRPHAAFSPHEAMRTALDHQNPLVATRVSGAAGGMLPADRFQLLEIGAPEVLAWAVKPAEEGIADGIVVRVWNVSDAPAPLDLGMPGFTVRSANRATHVETDFATATVTGGRLIDTLARQQLATYRLSSAMLPPPPPVDAGMPPGIDAGSDAGPPAADAARQDAGVFVGGIEDSGCGCRVGGRRAPGLGRGAVLGAGLVLLALGRRLRARRRSPMSRPGAWSERR